MPPGDRRPVRDHAGRGGLDAGAGEPDQPSGEVRVQQNLDHFVERDSAARAVGAVGEELKERSVMDRFKSKDNSKPWVARIRKN